MKRFVAVCAVFLTACSSAAESTTTSTTTVASDAGATSTTSSTNATIDVPAAIAALGPITTVEQIAELIEIVAEGGDVRYTPYLYDVSRFGTGDNFARAMEVLTELTGETAPGDDFRSQSLFFGNWIMANAPSPGPEYIAWKADLYGNIDENFVSFLAGVEDDVTASRIQWGGVVRGGIPELNDQPTISVSEAGYMQEDELVFGAVLNGVARAYPVRILGHHELANDTLGGEPVSMVFCTLCRTPVLFARTVDGRVLDFQTSGLLQNSNKVMVDIQTESLWNALTGEAFAGPLSGAALERLPMTVTTWADWIADHPDTDVQQIPVTADFHDPDSLRPPPGYSYQPGDAYRDYYASTELWFPTFEVPDVFAEKAEVVTLDYLGSQLAVGVEALESAGGVILPAGDISVVFVASEGGARVYEAVEGLDVIDGRVTYDDQAVALTEDEIVLADGSRLRRLVSGQSFWFAWFGNFPDTSWWPA